MVTRNKILLDNGRPNYVFDDLSTFELYPSSSALFSLQVESQPIPGPGNLWSTGKTLNPWGRLLGGDGDDAR